MPDKAENEHLRHLAELENHIRTLYESAVAEIAIVFSQIQWNGKTFQLKDYPLLSARITAITNRLHASIYLTTVNGIENAWDMSNAKNDVLVDKRLAGKRPTEAARQILYDSNRGALNAFLQRKRDGLNLSQRIWNTLDGYKTEMELQLGAGISEGKSAAEMARDMKRFLNEPERLFRRVRAGNGKLKLSKAARNYSPGQGQYRSSFLNARRLTATETNLSYRLADAKRWASLPFIIGIEVKTSNNHAHFDECDFLAGKYPADYVFTGNHPLCRCYAVSIQLSDEDYNKYEDALLRGEKFVVPESKKITEIPARAAQWWQDNAERVNGWANTPYIVKYNKKYLGNLLQKEPVG